MSKKIIVFFIFMLLLIPILSSTVTASQEPKIEIGKIRGRSRFLRGAIVIIEIKNTGDADALNVAYSSRIKHPLFELLDFTFNDTIDIIKAGDTIKIASMLSWIGRFEITVIAGVPGEEPDTKTSNGFSIFSFIIIFPS